MKAFIKRNIMRFVLTIFFVTIISFIFVKISPIDPAEAYARRVFITSDIKINELREEMGLNRPVIYQYVGWLKNAAHGNLGKSLITSQQVNGEVNTAFWYTAKIVLLSIVLQGSGAVFFSAIKFLNKGTLLDRMMNKIYVLAISVPPFIVASLILEILANQLHLIHLSNNEGISRYLPAAISLSINGIAYFTKLLSDSIEKQMHSDEAFYAKTLGLTDWQILKKYTLNPSILSVLPLFLQMMGMCFASSIIVEQVFGLPGIGFLILNSVLMRDSPMLHGIVLYLGITIATFLMIGDIFRKVGERYGI